MPFRRDRPEQHAGPATLAASAARPPCHAAAAALLHMRPVPTARPRTIGRPHVSLDRFCVPDGRGSRRRAGAARARRAPGRARGVHPETGAVAVYRDQLHEIAADQTRGVLSAGEAEAAKLEVSRRLLASAARSERIEPQASPSRTLLESRHATIALATAVARSPGDSRPLSRPRFAECALEPLRRPHGRRRRAGRARQHHRPGGSAVCARIPSRARAGRRLRRSISSSAVSAMLPTPTPMPPASTARRFRCSPAVPNPPCSRPTASSRRKPASPTRKSCKLEPGRIEPRFWLAMAKEQDGKLADALAAYKALLADAAVDASYRPPLTMRIQEVTARIAAIASARAAWAHAQPTWRPPPSSTRSSGRR